MDEPVKTAFPRLSLTAARVNANLSQEEAAKRLNISRQTLGNYETGKTRPYWEVVLAMAEVYGVPIDFLRLS